MGEYFNKEEEQSATLACTFIFAHSHSEVKGVSSEDKLIIIDLVYAKKWQELFNNFVWFECLKEAKKLKHAWPCIAKNLSILNKLFPEKGYLFV